jgi:hypothetical protein
MLVSPLLFVSPLLGGPRADYVCICGKRAGHSYLFRIATCSFHKERHRIRLTRSGGSEYVIDSRKAWGTDGGLPKREIASIQLSVDGRPWAVSSDAYFDCYEPHLDSCTSSISPNGRFAVLRFGGSDGAGGYEAKWGFSRKGSTWKRYIRVEDTLAELRTPGSVWRRQRNQWVKGSYVAGR